MKNQIREYRKIRGFTMQQLADMVGVSINAIHEYETNKYQPRADVIDKLLFFLGCSFDQLFVRESYQQIDFDEIISYLTDKEAMRDIDRHEAEYGADGFRIIIS